MRGGRLETARIARPSTLEWLYLIGGLALVLRYLWFFDDAFVYFRYVDNLLFLDSGLTYNRGEYVEGFSSPAQCLLLIALRALGLGYPAIVSLVGVVSFVTFGWMLVALNRRLSPSGPILDVPLAYLAFNYAVTSYFTSGLETPLVHVTAVAYALLLVRPTSLVPTLVVAASPLVRPELAAPLLLALAYTAWQKRGIPWRLAWLALLANGAWLCFRIYYYADLLPNTFYLKDDTRPALGLYYLRNVVDTYHLLPLLAAGGVALAGIAWSDRRRGAPFPGLQLGARLTMLALALTVAAYVVRIGGGAMHYYYLAFPFTLCVCSLAGIAEHVAARLGADRRAGPAVAVSVGIAAFSFSLYPPQLDAHPFAMNERVSALREINDPSWHRHNSKLAPTSWQRQVRIADMRRFGETLGERGYQRWSSRVWCQANYVDYAKRVVHGFGLTDAVLARTGGPGHFAFKRAHHPGHPAMANQIIEIQKRASVIGPGMYREALEAGRAPAWVAPNLETLEVIERKIYNRHDFLENLALALSFPPPVRP